MNIEQALIDADSPSWDSPDGFNAELEEVRLVEMARLLENSLGCRCDVGDFRIFQDGPLFSSIGIDSKSRCGDGMVVWVSMFGSLAWIDGRGDAERIVRVLGKDFGGPLTFVGEDVWEAPYSGKHSQFQELTWGQRFFSAFWPLGEV